jgi:hypothetical protein
MKFEELAKILDEHNKSTLEKLLGSRVNRNEREERWASVSVPVKGGGGDASGGHCYCGTTSHSSNCGDLISRCLDLQDASASLTRVAVGSVLDQASGGKDLPIVLVVGINYGQGCQYACNPTLLVEDTRMLSRTMKVLKSLSADGCSKRLAPLEQSFHLVSANFFPWITYSSWGESGFLNSIEESILLECVGYEDPVDHVSGLIDRVKPDAVIFHGANNIVPYLGIKVSKTPSSLGSDSSFILCDNLAPPGTKISNALVLCRKSQRTTLYQTNFDE